MTRNELIRQIEVDEIINILHPNERAALRRHPVTGLYGERYGGWPQSARDPLSFSQAGRTLMNLKLIRWSDDRRDSRTAMTRLGQAVLRALAQSPQTNGDAI